MAWHIDGKDIVIDGFAAGIADSAEQGISDMRNVNIISAPNEASVNYATTPVNIPPTVAGASCTFTGATDVVTWNGAATLYNGCSIKFGSTAFGVTQDVIYWVGAVTATTFKVYNAVNSNDPTNLINLSDGSNTFTTITMGPMTQHTEFTPSNYNLFQDGNGRCWWINGSGNLVHFGPLNSGSGVEALTNAHGNGAVAWAGGTTSTAGWFFAFRDAFIDVFPLDGLTNTSTTYSQWTNDWKAITGTSTTSHYAIASQDNAVYFCNFNYVGSILGIGTFDPSNGATFTETPTALRLQGTDRAQCLAELGNNLLVGGILNFIYPWDRISTSYAYPLIVAESNIVRMVSSNSNTYIFAGNRGRIYITNGSNIDLYKKFPDQIGLVPDPYWTWGGAIYWRNQLYFGIQSTTNAGGSLDTTSGVWAIDLKSNALRGTNTLSTLGYQAGTCPVIAPNVSSSTPGGGGYYAAWSNASTYGLDKTTTTPYATIGSGGQIDTDLIPIGTFFKPNTQGQIEFKLSLPLTTGEEVLIQARPYLRTSYTTIGSTIGVTGTNQLSDAYPLNFEKYQWVQFRIQTSSTASSPSFARLTEIRIHAA